MECRVRGWITAQFDLEYIRWVLGVLHRFRLGCNFIAQPLTLLGGGFKHVLFLPLPGEMIQFD